MIGISHDGGGQREVRRHPVHGAADHVSSILTVSAVWVGSLSRKIGVDRLVPHATCPNGTTKPSQAQGHRRCSESRQTFLGQSRALSPAPVRPLHGLRGPGNGESSCPPHRSSQKSGFVQSHGQWSSTPQVHLIGRGAVHWS